MLVLAFLVIGDHSKMVVGDLVARVDSDSLTSQGFEARPDSSSRLLLSFQETLAFCND